MTVLSPNHTPARSILPGDTRPVCRWVSADGARTVELSGRAWPALRDLLLDAPDQVERDAITNGFVELVPP